MITLILLCLIVLAVTYAVFFGIFKLIWILCRSNRNTWPLLLAGACTLALAVLTTLGGWWGVHKIMEPFQTMRTAIKNNPQPIYGQHTYKTDLAPYSLTVVDGMDFSDWINFDDGSVKLGIDTNVFKSKESDKQTYLAGAILRRRHPEDETFQGTWQKLKETENFKGRLHVVSEENVMVNGMKGYLVNAIAYTNRGPLPFWLEAVETEPQMTYYLLLSAIGKEDKTEQIKRILQSFRSSRLPVATPDNFQELTAAPQQP